MNSETWNEIIASLPQPHVLQSWQWGQVKAKYGWTPIYQVWRDERGEVEAAALILERALPIPGMGSRVRMLYAPKGPLLKDWGDVELRQRVLRKMRQLAKQRGAFFIKMDADVLLGTGALASQDAEHDAIGEAFVAELQQAGWKYSSEQVQFRNTIMLDLTAGEDDILARMKQKTRYNVRLSGRKGVTVREGGSTDFEMLYDMYAVTAARDGFVIRHKEYYLDLWGQFIQDGMLKPLIAEVEGSAVAALMLFIFEGRAWYIHGMSSGAHREKMATYLLQWEAMLKAKAAGCVEYDLWGAPDVFDESDSMWGVYRFKRGLGGQVRRHIGAWDLPINPWMYWLFTQILPRLMWVMRLRSRSTTSQEARGGP